MQVKHYGWLNLETKLFSNLPAVKYHKEMIKHLCFTLIVIGAGSVKEELPQKNSMAKFGEAKLGKIFGMALVNFRSLEGS